MCAQFFPETRGLELEEIDSIFEHGVGTITGGVLSSRGHPVKHASDAERAARVGAPTDFKEDVEIQEKL